MAYNNGFPMNYQPLYYPQQYQPQQYSQFPMQQQQNMQTPVQSYSPAINQSGIIWISGLQEAQMYPIAPNNAVALWQKDGKTIYLKSADATGRPSLVIYDLVERKETASGGSSDANDNIPAYATKDELSTIVGAVKGLAGEIETMKGDLYGVAGKRRSTKKAESETEE